MPVFSADYLGTVCKAIILRLGASEEEANIWSRCLVEATLRGKDIQGMNFIPSTVEWVRSGAVRLKARIRTVEEGPGFAVVDGGYGLGQVVATKAMQIAITKAQEAVVGSVWIRNVNDCTMMACYSMMALEHDFVGMAMSTGSPVVAPWGGRDPVFNTNPISIAIPTGMEWPIVIDSSTSAYAHGAVINAARDHARLPTAEFYDDSGKLTDDPASVIQNPIRDYGSHKGAIASMGPKGFCWLIYVDIFAGLMSGMTSSKDIPRVPTAEDPPTLGIFLQAIDVGKLVPIHEFKANVDHFIRGIKSSRLAEGFTEIILPGEKAFREVERRKHQGVPVREDDWKRVLDVAESLGVDLEHLRPKS